MIFSLVRSHVVFKLLNYVTDKIIRVVLTTLALMLMCVQTVCDGERAGEREYVLSVHNKTVILWQKHGYDLSFLSFCLLYLFAWPVSLWVLVLLLF